MEFNHKCFLSYWDWQKFQIGANSSLVFNLEGGSEIAHIHFYYWWKLSK